MDRLNRQSENQLNRPQLAAYTTKRWPRFGSCHSLHTRWDLSKSGPRGFSRAIGSSSSKHLKFFLGIIACVHLIWTISILYRRYPPGVRPPFYFDRRFSSGFRPFLSGATGPRPAFPSSKNSASVQFRADANRSRTPTVGFSIPRSSLLTYVRSTAASAANPS